MRPKIQAAVENSTKAGQITLWGSGTSRVIRVHWALIELGLAYRCEPLRTRTADMERTEFLALNPARKIPALKDGELVLTESAAIVTYLAEKYSNQSCRLIPTDLSARARYFEWLSFICMELDATSLYVLRRHEDLTHIYGAAPVANRACREYFDRMIKAGAQRLVPDQPYLLGREFSGADILLTSCLDWALRYKVPLPDVFVEYRDRIASRTGYQRAVIANKNPDAGIEIRGGP